jgi:hypothetical protein
LFGRPQESDREEDSTGVVMQGEAAALEAEVIRAVERLKEEAKEKALKGKIDADDLEYETQTSRKKEADEKSKKEAEEKAKLEGKKEEKAPKESEPEKIDPTGASAF